MGPPGELRFYCNTILQLLLSWPASLLRRLLEFAKSRRTMRQMYITEISHVERKAKE